MGYLDAVLFAVGICLTVLPPVVVAWLVSGSSSTFLFLLISVALGICLGIFSWRRHAAGVFIPASIPRGTPNLAGLAGVIDSRDPNADPDQSAYGIALGEKFRKQGLRIP
jgi:hypothetical protein